MKSNERLKTVVEFLMSSRSLNQAQVAFLFGYGETYLSDLLNGNKEINAKFLNTIQRKAGVNREYIEVGSGEMFLEQLEDQAQKGDSLPTKNKKENHHLSNEAILKLIDSTNVLAQANKKLADAHFIAAENSKRLLDKIEATENFAGAPLSKLSDKAKYVAALELISLIGPGKKYPTVEAARKDLVKHAPEGQ